MQTKTESLRIIRFSELNNLLGGVNKRTLSRWEYSGKFPKRIKLGEKSVGWILEDVQNWITSRRNN